MRCPIGDRGNLCQYETATSHRVQSDSGKTARQERALDHEAQLASNNERYWRFSELNCGVQLCGRAPSSDARQQSRKVTQELNAVRDTAQGSHGAEGAHCHLVRFPDEVRRDMPLPASGVAAVGHKIAESTVGIGTRPTVESNVAHNFALFRDTTAGKVVRGLELMRRRAWHLQRALIRCFGVCLLPVWELEVFVVGQGPRPDPARQSPCESNTLWLGSSGALKSASIGDREVQPERALAQSFVKSLRIPSRARCQGESFGHGVPGCGGRCGICWMQSVKWSVCWRWTSARGPLTGPVFRIGVEHF